MEEKEIKIDDLYIHIPKIKCEKHGVHSDIIYASYNNSEEYYCQRCWVETLQKCELVEE